jgi:hypothetical protein
VYSIEVADRRNRTGTAVRQFLQVSDNFHLLTV